MNESDVAVRVQDVSKRFVVRKEKSLKERIVNFGRSRKHREDFYALSHVSIDIERGSTVGLIGPNGSGKSTLLKTIGGIIQPTTGLVLHRGRVAALLELGAGFHPDLTGRENVYLNAAILGISRAQTEASFDDILEFSGIGQFIDTQVKFYSSGMYVRLAFAVAVNVDPDILIVDEVLAVGDEPFQRKCMERIRDLQRLGKTIVLVTHSLGQVSEFCDRAVVLESGRVTFDGDPGVAIQELRKDFELIRRNSSPDFGTGGLTGGMGGSPSITAVSIRKVDDDSELQVMESGESLALEVTLAVPDTTDDWIIGMGIETDGGLVAFGTNTELMGIKSTPIQGETVFRFEIGPLNLGEGQYFVHASYGTLSDGELFRVAQAGAFSVSEHSKNVGLLSSPVEGRLVLTRGSTTSSRAPKRVEQKAS